MNEINYLLAVILVMTVATYITRLTPFLLFSKGQESPLFNYISKRHLVRVRVRVRVTIPPPVYDHRVESRP